MGTANRVFAVAAVVLALAASARASVWTSDPIGGLAGSLEPRDSTYSGTGFVGVVNVPNFLGLGSTLELFGPFFGLSFPSVQIATALQVNITDLNSTIQSTNTVIDKATLSFDLVFGGDDSNLVSVTSFDTDGVLGYVWYPPALDSVDGVVVGGTVSQSIDVTDLLRARVDQQEDWLGLFLKSNSGMLITLTDSVFSSANAANVRLTVEYSEVPISETIAHQPEPTTLAIWSILGVALVAGRRRLFG